MHQTLQERFPPSENRPESGPLYDVWAHIFDAITAAEHDSARRQRALFKKRMEATQRVWGVVEPLLREKDVSGMTTDAFGREVRTFSCEHGTLVKIEGLGSEALWPVRLICPHGCDIEFERPDT